MPATHTQPLPELRPLNLGDVLDGSVKLYRHNLGTFLGISAVIHVPVTLLGGASSWLVSLASKPSAGAQSEALFGALTVHFLVIAIMLVLLPICQAALSLAVSEVYLGRPISVVGAYERTLRHLWPLLGSIFLAGLIESLPLLGFGVVAGVSVALVMAVRHTAAMVVAALVVIVVGLGALAAFLLFYVWFMFAPVAVVVEGRGAVESLRRSRELVRGRGWPIFGAWFILLLLAYAINGAISFVLAAPGAVIFWQELSNFPRGGSPDHFMLWFQTAGNLSWVLVMPLLYTGVVLLYYDQRVRKEGFDLEMMAQALGIPPAAPPAEPPRQTAGGPTPPAPWSAPVTPPQGTDPSPWSPPKVLGQPPSPQPAACPHCGRQVAAGLAVCPHCLQVLRPPREEH